MRAITLSWREKRLWLLGFIAGLGSLGVDIARTRLISGITRQNGGLADWLSQPENTFERLFPSPERIGIWLIWGTVVLFLVATVVWLMATWAEASIITSVLRIEAGESLSMRRSFAMGRKLLGRFIAIDAIVFLPLFLLLLLLMLGGMVALVAVVAFLVEGGSVDSSSLVAAVSALCLIPVFCLLFPLSVATTSYRTLAFREAAIRAFPVRASLRHSWRVVRTHLGTVIIWTALLWGVRYLFGLVTGAINAAMVAVMSGATILTLAETTDLGSPLNMLAQGLPYLMIPLTALGRAILFAFTAAAWTLIYLELVDRESTMQARNMALS